MRAFNVRTGKQVWRFDTIPRPGEFGNETWENGSWSANGNVGVWNQPTVDEELGLVYLPVETPTSDYGGHRPGNNLFAESIVAVEIKTGKRRWHYQLAHHPLWNYDMPALPIIADVVVDGKPRKVVAQLTKQAWCMRWTVLPASRSGRSRSGPCRSRTCRARRRRRLNRMSPSRRHTRASSAGAGRFDRLHA